ncbi:hypothetical protein [Halobaculum sp. P14]|uniref:hypothetical protein n=1 Tax=Halobaculum sp. P14 TaxID=3421638 RepID=UPI003EBF82A0
MQTLQKKSGSGVVTIPKDDLERDEILEDGALPAEQNVVVDRLGRRVYLVRFVDDTRIPEVEDTEVVERFAAQRLMNQDAFGQSQTAD